MISIITIDKQKELVEKQVNSKSISVYYFLYLLAIEDGKTSTSSIYQFNPHKILRLMKSKGIKTSYTQVKNSIDELELKGFLFRQKDPRGNTSLMIPGAVVNDSLQGEKKINAYINITSLMLTNDFYQLGIRYKRLFIFINNNFNKRIEHMQKLGKPINIRNKTIKDYFNDYLHLNSEAKIEETIEGIKPYFNAHPLTSKKSKHLTYHFSLSTYHKETFTNPLLTLKEKLLYSKKIKNTIDTVLRKSGKEITTEKRYQLYKTLLHIKDRDAERIIRTAYINAKDEIKHPSAYIKVLINFYFTLNKLLLSSSNKANAEYFSAAFGI